MRGFSFSFFFREKPSFSSSFTLLPFFSFFFSLRSLFYKLRFFIAASTFGSAITRKKKT